MRLGSLSAQAANEFTRGWLDIVRGGTGVADKLQFVRKNAANTYEAAEVFAVASGAAGITYGTGDPEGVVTAPVGAIFIRTDGGAGTVLNVKESGTGNTGWAAK